MSRIHSITTADYLPWDTMLNLIHRLFRDGDYKMSLLIGCGSFFGLRISDLRNLTWSQLLDDDTFTINETKTGKRRTIRVNKGFRQHIDDCYTALNVKGVFKPKGNTLFGAEGKCAIQGDKDTLWA